MEGFTRKKRGGGGSINQGSQSAAARPIGLAANQISGGVMNPVIEMSQFGSAHISAGHGTSNGSGFEEDD